jgi:hypothetical protein
MGLCGSRPAAAAPAPAIGGRVEDEERAQHRCRLSTTTTTTMAANGGDVRRQSQATQNRQTTLLFRPASNMRGEIHLEAIPSPTPRPAPNHLPPVNATAISIPAATLTPMKKKKKLNPEAISRMIDEVFVLCY